jgi:hypothetical protein
MHLIAAVTRTLLSLVCFLACVNVTLGTGDTAKGGPPVNGLCLRLEVPASKDPKLPPEHFTIVVENVGDRDLDVRLGYSLNNGRSHHPDSLELIARAGGEAPRRLIYFDGRGGIGGRVDPFVVPCLRGLVTRFAVRSRTSSIRNHSGRSTSRHETTASPRP